MPTAITKDLPDSKTGAKTVPLNGPAIRRLSGRYAVNGVYMDELAALQIPGGLDRESYGI